MERQMESLHCTVLPSHSVESANQFVTNLQEASVVVKVTHYTKPTHYFDRDLFSRVTLLFPSEVQLVCMAWLD